jgi:hypothetical protein
MSFSPSLTPEQRRETDKLVSELESFSESPDSKTKKLVRSTVHSVRDNGNRERYITSWKMLEYAYKREPCPFPTRARGLFTEKIDKDGKNKHRIVARGYDKVCMTALCPLQRSICPLTLVLQFFNVDEVSWTKVPSLLSTFLASLAHLFLVVNYP